MAIGQIAKPYKLRFGIGRLHIVEHCTAYLQHDNSEKLQLLSCCPKILVDSVRTAMGLNKMILLILVLRFRFSISSWHHDQSDNVLYS